MPGLRQIRPARLLAIAVLGACLAATGLAQPQKPEEARAALKKLQTEIGAITRELDSARGELDGLQKQLRDSEQRLGELARAMTDQRAAIDAIQAELQALQGRRETLQASADEQKGLIARELRAAWQQGQQAEVRLLLNQEDPHTLARLLAYYRYILRARQHSIDAFQATLAELEEVRQAILARSAELEAGQRALDEQQTAELAVQAERSKLLETLQARITDQDRELQQLQAERKEVEQLLEALERAVVDLQLPEDTRPFAEMRGKLPWPVSGKRDNSFGSARSGGLQWQGVNLLAEAGTPVRAIHHGRVVYADWLRGLGLLLILDHGNGFMSLYGHNQSLLREVGEWVNAGTQISTVGSSGGLASPALYFEIRRQGRPVDPVGWCR